MKSKNLRLLKSKMCNCYFGRGSRGCRFALFAHMTIYQRGADTPKNKWFLGIVRCISPGPFHCSRDIGVCHARLSVECGRCVVMASNMLFLSADRYKSRAFAVLGSTRGNRPSLQTACSPKMIFRCCCSGDLQIGQSS